MHSLPTNRRRASACSLTNSAEGETEDSNIDSGAERVVNVFLTEPVLFFKCHTWLVVWGVVLSDTNGKNRFAVSMLMLDSQRVTNSQNQLCIALCYSSDCLYCYQGD